MPWLEWCPDPQQPDAQWVKIFHPGSWTPQDEHDARLSSACKSLGFTLETKTLPERTRSTNSAATKGGQIDIQNHLQVRIEASLNASGQTSIASLAWLGRWLPRPLLPIVVTGHSVRTHTPLSEGREVSFSAGRSHAQLCVPIVYQNIHRGEGNAKLP